MKAVVDCTGVDDIGQFRVAISFPRQTVNNVQRNDDSQDVERDRQLIQGNLPPRHYPGRRLQIRVFQVEHRGSHRVSLGRDIDDSNAVFVFMSSGSALEKWK